MTIGERITQILAAGVGVAAGAGTGGGATLLTGVVQALILYRKGREVAKAMQPADPAAPVEPQFLEDDELIQLLQEDSAALEAHAARLLDKYAPADPQG